MLMSEELTDLKYQEILEYHEFVANNAINSMVMNNTNPQIGCLFIAIVVSFLMGCCAMVFMPSPKHKNQR